MTDPFTRCLTLLSHPAGFDAQAAPSMSGELINKQRCIDQPTLVPFLVFLFEHACGHADSILSLLESSGCAHEVRALAARTEGGQSFGLMTPRGAGLARMPFEVMPVQVEELTWFPPAMHLSIPWEKTMGMDEAVISRLSQLCAKAAQAPLTTEESTILLREIHLPTPSHLLTAPLTAPEAFPDIAENNPSVAIEYLTNLLTRPNATKEFSASLDALTAAKPSLRTLELVNKLATTIALPPLFLPEFSSSKLRACYEVQDKYLQQRLVRLVCVFLMAMVRSNSLDVKCALFVEVQAFCVDFSKVKEAVALLKMLKDL